jgi:hypothetical protein
MRQRNDAPETLISATFMFIFIFIFIFIFSQACAALVQRLGFSV